MNVNRRIHLEQERRQARQALKDDRRWDKPLVIDLSDEQVDSIRELLKTPPEPSQALIQLMAEPPRVYTCRRFP